MRRFLLILGICFLVLLPLSGCGASDMAEHTFFAMDTVVTIRISTQRTDGERLNDAQKAELFSEAERIACALEAELSRTIAESDVSRLNESTSEYTCESDTLPNLLTKSLAIACATDGAFSPTMGRLSTLWNVTTEATVPAMEAIREACAHIDYRTLSVQKRTIEKRDSTTMVDLGGIAKGYATEQLCQYLSDAGVGYGLVSFGGNIGVFGEKPEGEAYRIALTNPRDTAAICGMWTIQTGYIAVSGDYERYFEVDGVRYHHIFDPETGMPADSGLRSVAVHCEDGAMADALSTALFVMGEEAALQYYAAHPNTFEAILFTTDNRVICTPGVLASDSFTIVGDSFQLDA